MTKRDLLTLCAGQLGDTSPSFIADVLAPAFDLVMSELAGAEALAHLVGESTFKIEAGKRTYDTRAICGLTPHAPLHVDELLVFSWGTPTGVIRKEAFHGEINRRRLCEHAQSARPNDQWELWRTYPTPRTLEVWPPAGADHEGVEATIHFARPWESVGLDQDVLDIAKEDVATVVWGLRMHGATFAEQTAGETSLAVQKFEQGKKVMWGNRWNSTPGRVVGSGRHS